MTSAQASETIFDPVHYNCQDCPIADPVNWQSGIQYEPLILQDTVERLIKENRQLRAENAKARGSQLTLILYSAFICLAACTITAYFVDSWAFEQAMSLKRPAAECPVGTRNTGRQCVAWNKVTP